MNGDTPGQEWFDVRPVSDGVTAFVEPNHAECVISYLIEGRDRALLIDSGMGVGDIAALVQSLTRLPVTLVNSHAHWDHIGGNWQFSDIAIHRAEAGDLLAGYGNQEIAPWFASDHLTGPLPPGFDLANFMIRPSRASTILDGGEVFDLGDRLIEVIHAPGHSPGGIVLLDRTAGWLFTTDVAYPAPLYVFSEEANFEDYRRSMRLLAEIAPSIRGASGSHNEISMEPSMLIDMADALDAIADGRTPEVKTEEYDHHLFEGFSVYAPKRSDDERVNA